MEADRPVRRLAGRLRPDDRPIRLPHVDLSGEAPLFLGRPLDSCLLRADDLALWDGCDGGRPLKSWPATRQATVREWYASGLVVAARGSPATSTRGPAVVAPHPDDACLALGGLLAATGGQVVDVFTRETWTRQPYYRTRPELTAALLLAEERIACQVLGVEVELLGHVDAADRPMWSDGFLVPESSAEAVAAAEPELFAALVEHLNARLAGAERVLAPLAVGGHVDHLLCREAVLALVRAGRIDPAHLAFYEDMPYSVFGPAERQVQALRDRPEVGPLRPLCVSVPARCAEAKREAMWVYRLQVPEGVITRVLRHGRSLGGEGVHAERLWIPADRDNALDPDTVAAWLFPASGTPQPRMTEEVRPSD